MYLTNQRQKPRALLRSLAVGSTAAALMASGLIVASTSGSGAAPVANVAAAKAFIAPYQLRPSAFPIKTTLRKLPKKGTVVDYLSQGDPTTVAEYNSMKPGAKLLGINLKLVSTGATASTIATALQSVVAEKPAGVIDAGVDPVFFNSELKQLQRAGTKIVALAISDGAKYGIKAVEGPPAEWTLIGKLDIAWTIAESNGADTNIVMYTVPELPFLIPSVTGAQEELASLCPACTLRVVNIDITAIGSTAPQTIVSDLQANPSTQAAIFAADAVEVGLPPALQQAGIKIDTVGVGPDSSELTAILEGQEDAALGIDQPVGAWELLDEMARLLTHQTLVGGEKTGIQDIQFLTSSDLAGHIEGGLWTGYPNYIATFKVLWGLKK